MTKPIKLTMELDREQFVQLLKERPELQAAAKAFLDAGTPRTNPEAQEIWRLATKFLVTGQAFIETPAGNLTVTLFGVALGPPRDPADLSKYNEMVDRANAVDGGP